MNTAPSFYIAIPANTPLWFVVLFHHHYMYRTLTDSKFLRRLTHCRIVFYDIIRNVYRAFFDIILQGFPP